MRMIPEEMIDLFQSVAEKKLLTSSAVTMKVGYEIFVNKWAEINKDIPPIGYPAFTHWCKTKISTQDWISAREGKKALKEFLRNKTGVFEVHGFLTRFECDALHDPIGLRCPHTLKKMKYRPIHYFVVEALTGCIVGFVTDYHNRGERSEWVIESYKSAMCSKRHFQKRYGTVYPFIQFGRAALFVHDAGKAYTAGVVGEFFLVAANDSMITRTGAGYDKPFVEAINGIFKKGFTRRLPGSYNDNQKSAVVSGHVKPVLTTLEHEVLMHRYICDDFHQQVPARNNRKASRQEQWRAEASITPPMLPARIDEVMTFQGIADTKAIQAAVGIQHMLQGTRFTYNSDELQSLRIRLGKAKGKKWDGMVDLRRSSLTPDFIKVYDSVEDEWIRVPRVNTFTPRLEGVEMIYRQYAELQTLERLASMSSHDIIEAAKVRAVNLESIEKRESNTGYAVDPDEAYDDDYQGVNGVDERSFYGDGTDEPAPNVDEDTDWQSLDIDFSEANRND